MTKPVRQRRTWTPDALIEETLPYVLTSGLSAVTLRGAAESIGTSHKVLLHHFGSRGAYIAQALRFIRGRLRAATVREDPVEMMEAVWTWYLEHPAERDVLAQGLGFGLADPGELGRVARDGVEHFADIDHGFDPAFARLVRASFRGLLIESVVSGDPASVQLAFEQLLALVRSVTQTQQVR